MFINSGFTFLNIKGTYKYDNGTIQPLYEYGLMPVYSPHNRNQESIFYQFASLNEADNDSIVEFCNKYGLLFHNKIINNNSSNNYVFFNISKDKFTEITPAESTTIPISRYKEAIYFARSTIDLLSAISTKDFRNILNIIMYLLLGMNNSNTFFVDTSYESSNLRFTYFVVCHKYSYNFQEYFQHVSEIYLNDDTLHTFFEDTFMSIAEYLIKNNGFNGVDSNGHIILENELNNNDIDIISERLIRLAAAIVNDIFNWILKPITPIMKFVNGKFTGDWEINNLLQAMFFEFYISISQDILIKKCPCCGSYFEVAKTNSRKKYCSDICNDRMAQRRRRERQKK